MDGQMPSDGYLTNCTDFSYISAPCTSSCRISTSCAMKGENLFQIKDNNTIDKNLTEPNKPLITLPGLEQV
jgi:hypothetical protein